MGFWGSLILCRPSGELDQLEAITRRDEGVEKAGTRGELWRVGRSEGLTLLADSEIFMREMVAETNAPAITGFVFDSDCIDLVGYGLTSGMWRACLGREAMAAYIEGPIDEVFLRPHAAAHRGARWAEEAGLRPDADKLLKLFLRQSAEPFVETMFTELIDHLGVPPAGSGTPSGAPRKVLSQRRQNRRPSNYLDAFIFDFVSDVFKDLGFTKKGRTFRLVSDRGDIAAVKFRAQTDFLMEVGVVHQPIWQALGEQFGVASYEPDAWHLSSWQCQWGPMPTGGAWHIPTGVSERQEFGRQLGEILRNQVAPTLLHLFDRQAFVDISRGHRGRLRAGHVIRGPADEIRLLVRDGPSNALDDAIGQLTAWDPDHKLLGWAREELSEQGIVGDAWRYEAREPRRRLQFFLDQYVAPTMTDLGFESTDLGFRLVNGRGDQVLIGAALSALSGPDRQEFYVDAGLRRGVETVTSGRAAAASSNRRPGAEGLWHYQEIEPPPLYALRDGPLAELGIKAWSLGSVAAASAGAALAQLLRLQALRLCPYLSDEGTGPVGSG